jgi:hypothetical protein
MIVSVNGATLNQTVTAQEINKVYAQANVSWSVTAAPGFTFDLGQDGLEGADANLLTKYSAEMRALRDAYKQAHADYDKEAYYVFVVPAFKDANLRGYMVRGRALGFVTASATVKEVTHELAHGAFGLEHTFPEVEKGSTSNLLDYGSGVDLNRGQWEFLRIGGFICSWFDKEEDGSLNKECHAGLTPSGRIFDDCYDENNNRLSVTLCLTQGNYCITSLIYKNEKYNWDTNGGFYINKVSGKILTVNKKPKPINKVNVYRINAPGCSYQSTAIEWIQNISNKTNIQAEIESKLNSTTLWDTDLFAGVKPNNCGASNGNELTNCPSFPQNMEMVDLKYLKDNFFAFSPTSCLSTLIFKKRLQLIREMLNSWSVTECVQNINPSIPSIGNCYEPLVYKLILSTPSANEKELLDSLLAQNLIYPLLNKTQYTTFDEIAKKLATWQINYYPISGDEAVLGKINGTINGVEFISNKVTGNVNSNGVSITREGYGICKECVPVSDKSIQVPFMSYVLINFKDKIDVFTPGTKARIPAIFALYLFNKDRREFLESSGKLIFDIAMLGIGVGEIQAAFNAYKASRTAYQTYIGLKALTDVGMSIGDMIVSNALAETWNNTEEGRKRLERWNKITLYWALGSISSSSLDEVINKYCNSTTKVVINEGKFDELADELEGIVNNSGSLPALAGKASKGIGNVVSLDSPVGLFRQLKGTNGQVYRASNFWNDEGPEIIHYVSQDLKYYIKHDPSNGRVLFISLEENKFISFMLDQDNLIQSDYGSFLDNLKTIHGFPNSNRVIKVKGENLSLANDKANLILGKYKPNNITGVSGELGTDDVIEEMRILKNYSFADKNFELRNGSVHVLNIPDGMYNPETFFETYNKELLDLAVNYPNRVKVTLVSDPRKSQLLYFVDKENIKQPTGFAMEIKYLRDRGIKNISLKDGSILNLDYIDLNNINWNQWKY